MLLLAYQNVQRDHADLPNAKKWQIIADQVGDGRTKHDCYQRYKELLAIRAKEKEEKERKVMVAVSNDDGDEGEDEYADDYEQEDDGDKEKKENVYILSQPKVSASLER